LNVLNRVKELRERQGWTQQELAEAVGVSRQSINSIERQRYVPSLSLALLFARIFRTSTDDIFELEKPAPAYARPRDDFFD
jgi:putative transcriptional regulator